MCVTMTPDNQIEHLDPEVIRLQRDRQLALMYVQNGETSAAMKAVLAMGVPRRTAYRAVRRQLLWARTQAAHEARIDKTKETAA